MRKIECFSASRTRGAPLVRVHALAHPLLVFNRQFQGKTSIRREVGMTPGPDRTTEEVLRRVKGEFLEMPGLRLTEPQARRLWGLDGESCSALLSALVDANFLFRTRDGAFVRVERSR